MKEYAGKDKHKIALFEPMAGATAQANGEKGLVPAPLIADRNKFLRGDGTWAEAGGGGTGTITDVQVDGVSVVTDGVAEIDLSGYAETADLSAVATSGDYTDLINTPSIPSKTSDLTNDSGYITTETDPTVPSWAKASTKPSYDYYEIENTPTLGTAAAKDYTTSVTQNSNDLVTSGAVFSAIDNLPVPMVFKGTLGTGGTITSLPTASASNEGYTYKVITAGTYASQTADIGDVFVSNGTDWVLIPAGDETFTDTWREIKVNGTSVLGSSINTGALNLKAGINMGIAVDGNDLTFSATDTTYSDATQSVHGLMSTADKIKLDGIATGAEVNVNADWNATSGDAEILNKPTIPTVNNGTLTIQKNGTTVQTFSANQSENATANITLAKSDVGLSNVDNTADVNKNVSSATKLTKTETVLATDKVPYVFRKALTPSGYSGYIIEKLIGGSIAWNQLIQASASNWSTYHSTKTYNSTNNEFEITLTEEGTRGLYSTSLFNTFPVNHKVLVTLKAKATNTMSFRIYFNNSYKDNNSLTNNYSNYSAILNSGNPNEIDFYIEQINGLIGEKMYIKDLMLFDLTLMFGSTIADYVYSLESATAGSGIAKLKEWGFFTKSYYNYNAGTIQNVSVKEKRITGFNQFDKDSVTLGKFVKNDGTLSNTNVGMVSYYIRVSSNTEYYLKNVIGASTWYTTAMYDATKTFISNVNIGGSGVVSGSITTPSNAEYMRVNSMQSDIDSVCINISDPNKNGTYEPYHVDVIPLATEELRGIPKLDANNNLYYDGDEYTSDGTCNVRYETTTFDGSENWGYYLSHYFYILLSDSKFNDKAPKINNSTNIISNLFKVGDIFVGSSALAINESALPSTVTDLQSFKTWLSNNNLTVVYELGTPVTFNLMPYQNPQWCKNGTEQFILPYRDVDVPVGHVTECMGSSQNEYLPAPTFPVDSGDFVPVCDGHDILWKRYIGSWKLVDTDSSTVIIPKSTIDKANEFIIYGYWTDLYTNVYEDSKTFPKEILNGVSPTFIKLGYYYSNNDSCHVSIAKTEETNGSITLEASDASVNQDPNVTFYLYVYYR